MTLLVFFQHWTGLFQARFIPHVINIHEAKIAAVGRIILMKTIYDNRWLVLGGKSLFAVCSWRPLARGQKQPGKQHLMLTIWEDLPQCFLSRRSHAVLRPVPAGHPALSSWELKRLVFFFLRLFPRNPSTEHGLLCYIPFTKMLASFFVSSVHQKSSTDRWGGKQPDSYLWE